MDRKGGLLLVLGQTGPRCFDDTCSLLTRGTKNKTQIDQNRDTPLSWSIWPYYAQGPEDLKGFVMP